MEHDHENLEAELAREKRARMEARGLDPNFPTKQLFWTVFWAIIAANVAMAVVAFAVFSIIIDT